MKQFSFCFFLLFATSIAHGQQAGQLYITSYNDTVDIGYVCHGVPQDTVFIGMGAINFMPSVPITVDSFTYHVRPKSDTVNFQYIGTAVYPFTLGKGAFYHSGPNWVASHPGDDTLVIVGYYNGQFTDTAHLLFHARNSPDLAMYGYTSKLTDVGGGNKIGGIQQAEETDTMHDKLDQPYIASSTAQETGMSNNVVTLRSCGGAVIDSIIESGNLSEFAFDPFPSLPYTLGDDGSLVLRYKFTPQIVDTSGHDHHYLIFHTTDGHYLTWSFEYKVYPASSVTMVPDTNFDLQIFPNPASTQIEIASGPSGTARLFDLLGREVSEMNDDGSGATLDVSKLEAGAYFLRIGNQSTRVEITH